MRTIVLAAALAAVVGSNGPSVQTGEEIPIRPESRVSISGTSNVRKFECRASGLTGSMRLRIHATPPATLAGENVSASPSVAVPVGRIDCGIGRMSRHLRATLRADANPAVTFRLTAYEVDFAATEPEMRLMGRLQIAGREQPLDLVARLRADSSGAIHVTGEFPVRMTSFGVRPPRRFAGLLRVRDQVNVHFDIVPECADDALNDAANDAVLAKLRAALTSGS